MKSMIYVILLVMVGLVGCSTTSTSLSPPAEASQASLFDEAHRCEGVVKYQAEMQDGRMRSRVQCEWTVSPDEWGAW